MQTEVLWVALWVGMPVAFVVGAVAARVRLGYDMLWYGVVFMTAYTVAALWLMGLRYLVSGL